MDLNTFHNYFATLAQISFTVAGFLLIALTVNENRRRYWFRKPQVGYVFLHFLLIIIPGLISLLGLTPIQETAVGWFFCGVGLIYLTLWGIHKRLLTTNPELTAIQENLGNTNVLTLCLGFMYMCLAGLALRNSIDLVGFFLIYSLSLALLFGILVSFAFFRVDFDRQDDELPIESIEVIPSPQIESNSAKALNLFSSIVSLLVGLLFGLLIAKESELSRLWKNRD